jgi:hypothetical protein
MLLFDVLGCWFRLAATMLHLSGASANLVAEFLEQHYQRAHGRAHQGERGSEPMISDGSVYAPCFIQSAEAVLASPRNEQRSLYSAWPSSLNAQLSNG